MSARVVSFSIVAIFACCVLIYSLYQRTFSMSARLDRLVQAFVDEGSYSGTVLVAKSGKIVFKKAYGCADIELAVPNAVSTRFNIASVTKQFTALAIMQLQELGKLNVKNSLSLYIPDYPNGDKITIHQLLTHTSGIANFSSAYKRERMQHYSLEERIALFKDQPLESNPGEKFSYADSNYILLTYIIEKASGQTYGEFLKDHIFNPLIMHDTGCDLQKPIIKMRASGYSVDINDQLVNADFIDLSYDAGAGILYSTVDDLYKWDRALYENKIITKESLSSMFTANADYYGYGWDIEESEYGKIVYHQGRNPGFRAIIVRNLDYDICIILLSNFEHCDIQKIAFNLQRILFGNQPEYVPQPFKEIRIASDIIAQYVGTYEAKVLDMTFIVSAMNNKLFIEIAGQEKILLHPVSDHEFFLKFINGNISFIKGTQGNVERIIVQQDGEEIVADKIK